jgi:hypothetical protein
MAASLRVRRFPDLSQVSPPSTGPAIAPKSASMGRFLFCVAVCCLTVSAQPNPYFPDSQPLRWTLRHSSGAEFTFDSKPSGDGVEMTARGPWGVSSWRLKAEDGVYRMTHYGTVALAEAPVLFSFTAAPGTSWANMLGRMTVDFRGAAPVGGALYADCVRIRQESGDAVFTYTFAAGFGLIRYTVQKESFDLDPAKSILPAPAAAHALPLIGILPTPFADRPDTPQAAMDRLALLSSIGCKLLLSYGDWAALEPSAGRFALDSVRFVAHEARMRGWNLSYTLAVIDMHRRAVPADLQHVAWDDPRMQARVLALIDAILPLLRESLITFQFGNEVDTYFALHPAELEPFSRLLAAVSRHLKSRMPALLVSTTFKSTAIGELGTTWNGLWRSSDVLSITYGGYNATYRVKASSAIAADLAEIFNRAEGKKILFQEVAYPSGEGAGSSPALQAEFFATFLRLLRMPGNPVIGAQIMMLSDLSWTAAWFYADAFGMSHSPAFVSVLASLGLYDANGQAKPALEAVRRELAR